MGAAVAAFLLWVGSGATVGTALFWFGLAILAVRQLPLAVWMYRDVRANRHKTRLGAVAHVIQFAALPYYENAYVAERERERAMAGQVSEGGFS